MRVTRTLPAGKNSGDTWYSSTFFSCSLDGLGACLGTFSNALSVGAKILLADKYSCLSEISGQEYSRVIGRGAIKELNEVLVLIDQGSELGGVLALSNEFVDRQVWFLAVTVVTMMAMFAMLPIIIEVVVRRVEP